MSSEADKEKKRAYAKAYYAANRDRIRQEQNDRRAAEREAINAKRRADYQKNKEAILAAGKAYRQRNRDAVLARRRAYHHANKQAANEKSRRWHHANKSRAAQYKRERRKADPTLSRAARARRRARKRGAGGSFKPADVRRILKRQMWCCAACACDLRVTGYEVDHWMPLALGGSNDPINLQALCLTCNRRKGAKHPLAFWRELMEQPHVPP